MKAYIIHSTKSPERKKHMLNQLRDKNIDFSFITEGEKEDITEEILNKYFDGELKLITAATSCAYKHLIAYFKILEENLDLALILEDDIFLKKNFNKLLDKVVLEIKNYGYKNFLVSLEESTLEYVKRSELVKNKLLYNKKSGRTAGAYLIDKFCAEALLSNAEKEKCKLPLDWFHNECVSKNLINIFWLSQPIAVQGTLSGRMNSLIDGSYKKSSNIRAFIFEMKRLYKKILYFLR